MFVQRRKYAATYLDRLAKELTVPISEVITAYTRIVRIAHPYEGTVAQLTFAARRKSGKPSLDVCFGACILLQVVLLL